jgi:hypothetical protein
MLRRDLLGALAATPLAGWLRPWVPAALRGAVSEEPNAAAIYRTAFGWLKGLRREDRDRLHSAATMALDDPQIDALLQLGRPALEAIHEGAAVPQCHWGTEILTCDDLGKDRLDVVATLPLIRVACLSARRHAASGRGREALDDVFAGLTLAHRLGTGGVLMARVLECSGECTAFQTLGRILPGLEPAALDDLSRRLDALPPPEEAGATIGGAESRFVVVSLRAKLMAMGPVVTDEKWDQLGLDEPDAALALKRLVGSDRARLLAHLDATRPAFIELARRLDLPRPECRRALEEFAAAERMVQPVAAGLVEAAWSCRHMVDRMRALRSTLRAGLALVRGGEPAFRAVSDPFGSGPFGLERRGKGYRIRSGLNDDDRPEVTLELGDAA